MAPFENLEYPEFSQRFSSEPDAVLIDVRTPAEVQEAHIPNSIHINVQDPDFIDKIEKLDTSKRYFVYCRSGARSSNACMQMSTIGFEKLVNLKGGIMGWKGEVVRG